MEINLHCRAILYDAGILLGVRRSINTVNVLNTHLDTKTLDLAYFFVKEKRKSFKLITHETEDTFLHTLALNIRCHFLTIECNVLCTFHTAGVLYTISI